MLRTDTALDIIRNAFRGGDQNAATRQMIGQIVMTKYNKKTYKVDNIDWNKSPSHTFPVSTYS